MTTDADNNELQVLTPENLTIYSVAELRELFKTSLAEHNQLEVNLAQVSEIDCAGLQLMVSLKKSALAEDKNVAFTAHSREVVELLDLLNMHEFFGDQVMLSKA